MSDLSKRLSKLTPEQLAVLAQRLYSKVDELERNRAELERKRAEPIAVVGVGCRFPGGANDPDSYWSLLRGGVDAMREVPADRWDVDAFYDPDPDTPGKTYTREAGFIGEVDRFDPQFFGISPLEAEGMDPQQRLLLEVSWEALERAGQAPSRLRRTEVGVFVGIMTDDYQNLQANVGGFDGMNAYTVASNEFSVVAGRLSYFLGLQGPTMAVSTACSSSLVAVHLASQALRGGECHMALAGGVNLMLSPWTTVAESKARMLSPQGRCMTFDARADGTARGEGCGVVVLKRLSDAVADGDTILALLRGSAVNHDGPSSSFTAPNGPSQQAVIRRALSSAKLEPADVGYLETHGTATPLGDPIEVGALSAVFGGREGPLALGSVKTNFGHLEAAAGMAGLIKVVLALHHEEIPPHLHLREINPHIAFEDAGVVMPTVGLPWPSGAGQRRVAGLSSFGLSGTNAHVVLEEAPAAAASEEASAASDERPEQVLMLSARSEAALAALAGRYGRHLEEHPELDFADVCHTAQTARSHLEHRAAVVASSAEQARARLEQLQRDEESPDVVRGQVASGRRRVAFLFTGQGSQYVGMGRELYAAEPVFREAIDRCAEVLKEYLDPPLLQVMHGDEAAGELLDQTGYTQPALFSVEYAVSELWRSWGLTPGLVLGHSVGELVAAVVAGVFDLEQGLRLVAERGRMMQRLPEGGAMAAILTEEGKVVEALSSHGNDVSIAAVNGPESVVISGVAAAVDSVASKFEEGGVRVRRLRVSHAFHSPLMEPMLDEFERVAKSVSYSSPKLTLISNVTGKVAGAEVCSAGYWRRHVREGVRFAAGMQALRAAGADVLLEVGPAPLLLGMGRHCIEDEGVWGWLPSLRRGQPEREQILRAAGGLYTAGVDLDWGAVDGQTGEGGRSRKRVPLPTYAFQRERYWLEGADASVGAKRDGERERDWLYEVAWREQPGEAPEPASSAEPGGRWLVVADEGGVGEALAAQLHERGEACEVLAGSSATAEDYARVLSGEESHGSWRGVVHLRGLDATLDEQTSQQQLDEVCFAACGSLLELTQAVAKLSSPPRIWSVTRGAQAVGRDAAVREVAQATSWGLGRVVRLEHPELWGGLVDLDPGADVSSANAARQVLATADASDGEDLIAYRGGTRYVARLERSGERAGPAVSVTADASYLVTGGFGGLGLEVAQWLVERGARHLVLVGRRGAVGDAVARVEQLEAMGAQVMQGRCDISSSEDVARLFAEIAESQPPLRGVIHSAGVLDDGVVLQQSWERFSRVFAAKVQGGWNLHRHAAELPLDFFVLFSSQASLTGNPGQSGYSAANAFVDALAHYRRGRNQHAVSVNWGPWGSVGMAAGVEEEERRRERMGVSAIPVQRGLSVLEKLLAHPSPQVGVLRVSWSRLQQALGATLPLFEELAAREPGAAEGEPSTQQRSGLVQELASLSGDERRERLTAHVQSLVQKVLGRGEEIEPEQPLMELGVDSLMAVELRNVLGRSVGQKLSATLAFDYPNVGAIVGYLEREVFATAAVTAVQQRTASQEPVAIVGMGCRFPGGAETPEKFWRLLRGSVDAVKQVPGERWDIDAYYDEDQDAPGKMYTRWGGFLDQIDQFDPMFFGITPREAEGMDPQQRLLLEVAWEALESAGQPPDRLGGSRTGVFVGLYFSDYFQLWTRGDDLSRINGHTSLGTSHSAAVGRLSYLLGLQGPAVALDTACSSSLVGLHLACQSLRSGECRMALAGGVSLLITPATSVALSRGRFLSATGRCSTFDSRADGMIRGEGCGVVVLKRLSDAVADGDNILALVRGTAVNQDGRSSALTAPNGPAQEAVIHDALATAGLEPSAVSYVEAHGTGTPLGDPIEIGALKSVFSGSHPGARELAVGSVKTNIGHLEAAAGIAGLIKTVLAMQHEEIPPHLHVQEVNPHISFEDAAMAIPGERLPWPRGGNGQPRVAGLSSFGFSGTNAHVVLQEAPEQPAPEAQTPEAAHERRAEQVLMLSGRNEAALAEQAARYGKHLDEHPELDFADVCYTARTARSHLERRAAVVASSAEQARARLELLARGEESPDVVRGHTASGRRRVAFLFTGQGSQYVGMGRELYEAEPVFRAAMDRCAEVLREYLDPPLLQVLYGDDAAGELIDQTAYTQPALFAVEYAVSELWRSWGLTPSHVLGHSIGELVAAVVAGVFDLEQGLRLVAERGRMMQALPEGAGAMAAILTEEARVVEALAAHGDDVSIAAVNGPESVVISGVAAAVDSVASKFEEAGVRVKRLRVSHAFHSPMMEPMLGDFEQVAQSLSYSAPKLTLISNVTGQVAGDEVCTASYWRRHVREGVRFAAGMQALRESGADVLLEVGPAPLLLGMGRQCIEEEGVLGWLPSLRRGQREREQILRAAGGLYAAGVELDWNAVDGDAVVGGTGDGAGSRERVPLPTYAFQRKRYWLEGATPGQPVAAGSGPSHPFLGRQVVDSTVQVFEALWRPDAPALLADHLIHGMVVVPGAGYVDLVLEAAVAAFGQQVVELQEVIFQEPLVFSSDEEQRRVQVVFTPDGAGGYSFQVISCPADEQDWTQHASGKLQVGGSVSVEGAPAKDGDPIAELQARFSAEVDMEEYYESLHKMGLSYGPAFQRVEQLFGGSGKALGRLTAPPEAEPYQVFPGVLDSCFQVLGGTRPPEEWREEGEPYIPLSIDRFRYFRRPSGDLWCHVSQREQGGAPGEAFAVDIHAYDTDGELVLHMDGARLKRAPRDALLRMSQRGLRQWLYQERWEQQDPTSGGPAVDGRWLVFADEGGVGERLAASLVERGAKAELVWAAQGFEQRDGGGYGASASDGADIERVLKSVTDTGDPLRGVIHLWSLDSKPAAQTTQETLRQDVARSSGSALHLLQALARAGQETDLWFVTRGSQAVSGEAALSCGQAPLWGMARVLRLEHPDLRCVRVDLDGADADGGVAELLTELSAAPGEEELAYRGGSRYVRRLVRGDSPRSEVALSAEGTYVVTGGLGALGLVVLRWMVQQGARHLLVLSRSGAAKPEAEAPLAELREMGAEVVLAKADVTDEAALAEVLAKASPAVRGVVHMAGVLDDGMLQQQDWQRFGRVLGPKVHGTWALHEQLAQHELDLFVMFSSAASLVGKAGQGNYAAANAFMDALAHQRRAEGRPAVSINWGPWGEIGMAAELGEAQARRGEQMGISPIPPQRGLQMLGMLLGPKASQVGVLPIDWARLMESLPGDEDPPLLSKLLQAERARSGAKKKVANKRPELLERLKEAPAKRRKKTAVAYLKEEVARVLGFDSPSELDPEGNLMDLGVDSMMAVDLRNALRAAIDRPVPATVVFDYPSVAAIAGFVLEELALPDDVQPAAEEPAAEPTPTEEDVVEQLSDDEMWAALADELGKSGD